MAKAILDSKRIDGPDGRHIQILFYDDGSIRFRLVKAGPMVITESYIQGQGKSVILGVAPARLT